MRKQQGAGRAFSLSSCKATCLREGRSLSFKSQGGKVLFIESNLTLIESNRTLIETNRINHPSWFFCDNLSFIYSRRLKFFFTVQNLIRHYSE